MVFSIYHKIGLSAPMHYFWHITASGATIPFFTGRPGSAGVSPEAAYFWQEFQEQA